MAGALKAPCRAPAAAASRRAGRSLAVVPRAYIAEEKASTRAAEAAKPVAFKNQLEALKSMSTVVADTGEVGLVKKYAPQDCTTNPSLVYKAVTVPEYQHFLPDALAQDKLEQHTSKPDAARPYSGVADILAVNMGIELLQLVPGRVSTEVDAHLSYNTDATVDKALRLVDLYAKKGIDTNRLYIKMASTWEGIEACRRLQKQGIDTNMTLLFSFAQAAACADAGAALISPFVGRILDWHKAKEGRDFASHEDPGVLSVQKIYKYYKASGYKTIVMAASFRNIGEIRELAGCDNITIAPSLLAELEQSTEPLPRKLWPEMGGNDTAKLTNIDSELFYKLHNADQMAVDKLKQGIDSFAADQKKLEELLAGIATGAVKGSH